MESKIKVNPDSPLNSTVFDGRPAASASGVAYEVVRLKKLLLKM